LAYWDIMMGVHCLHHALRITLTHLIRSKDQSLLQLSFDLLESWLESNSDVLALERKGRSVFRELALFQDYHGFPDLKNV
jgi:hypothetical protein